MTKVFSKGDLVRFNENLTFEGDDPVRDLDVIVGDVGTVIGMSFVEGSDDLHFNVVTGPAGSKAIEVRQDELDAVTIPELLLELRHLRRRLYDLTGGKL